MNSKISTQDKTQIITNWLLSNGPTARALTDLLEGYCLKLRQADVPIDRSTFGAPLLHPIAQSSFVFWSIEKGAEQRWFQWTPEALETIRASPIFNLYEKGEGTVINLADEQDRARFPVGADLWEEGYYQYHAIPIPFSDGSNKAFTAATKVKGGFSGAELEIINATLPLLTIIYEGFIARNAAITLMETYVGKRAGLQVLDGHIARGDGSHIDAVIWFSDLRGFTELSTKLCEEEMLDLLNTYLALITEAIEEQGGEVLKYIGDAVMAIFPVGKDAKQAIKNAETAALDALKKREGQNFDFAIALHRGEVFYGNIGGGSRLDFTVIGSAVNLAARIEGLCSTLGQSLLVSTEFAELSSCNWHTKGQHQLKGIDGSVEVFGQK